jgi:hypothetical protein
MLGFLYNLDVHDPSVPNAEIQMHETEYELEIVHDIDTIVAMPDYIESLANLDGDNTRTAHSGMIVKIVPPSDEFGRSLVTALKKYGLPDVASKVVSSISV